MAKPHQRTNRQKGLKDNGPQQSYSLGMPRSYQATSIIVIKREAVLAQVVVCSPSWSGQGLEGLLREPVDLHPATAL